MTDSRVSREAVEGRKKLSVYENADMRCVLLRLGFLLRFKEQVKKLKP